MALRILWIMTVFLLWPGWLWAVEVVDGPRVEVAGTTATVRWKLDSPAGGTVRFGLSEGMFNRSAKSPAVAAEHVVRLEGLKPGTRYFYSVGTSRRPLRDGSFTVAAEPAGRGAGPAVGEPPSDRAPDIVPSPPKKDRAEPLPAAPPASKTWANLVTLRDHHERHGSDFAATSPENYAAQAWRFLQRAKTEGLPAKLDPEGTLRVWDPRTRAFAAYNRQGLTKTYFKPGSGDYFERQPGRPVRLKPDSATATP